MESKELIQKYEDYNRLQYVQKKSFFFKFYFGGHFH